MIIIQLIWRIFCSCHYKVNCFPKAAWVENLASYMQFLTAFGNILMLLIAAFGNPSVERPMAFSKIRQISEHFQGI
jgi:hypothetical protein